MDVPWSKDKLYKIFSKDSLPMTINAHASGDCSATMRCCRLCRGDAGLRGINETYMCEGVEERYDKLLYDCFGVRAQSSDSLICEHCVRQLRNINRFRMLVHTAFVKQQSEYSSKHSHLGVGEGYISPLKELKDDDRTIARSKEVVKMRKRSRTIELSKKREQRRERCMSTNVPTKRMNIPCIMCNQRYPMIVPFEGWKEFICSRCKKNRDVRTADKRSSVKMAPSMMRRNLALNSKAELSRRSRLCCLSKKSTQLSKIEGPTKVQQQQRYQCTLCPKKFMVAQHLAHHMSIVHGIKPDKQYSVSNKDLRIKESLIKPGGTLSGRPVFQCDVCLKNFKERRTFQNHYLTHNNPHRAGRS